MPWLSSEIFLKELCLNGSIMKVWTVLLECNEVICFTGLTRFNIAREILALCFAIMPSIWMAMNLDGRENMRTYIDTNCTILYSPLMVFKFNRYCYNSRCFSFLKIENGNVFAWNTFLWYEFHVYVAPLNRNENEIRIKWHWIIFFLLKCKFFNEQKFVYFFFGK